jgi:predicted DNA-binding transcriptional regulator AlpA
LALLSKKQLAELLSIDAWSIDRWRRDPDSGFPPPIWIGGNTARWRRADIETWLNNCRAGGKAPSYRRAPPVPPRRRRVRHEARDGSS